MKKGVTDTWTDKVSEEANNRDAPLEKFKSCFALTVHAVGIQKKKKKVIFTYHDNFLISAWIFWLWHVTSVPVCYLAVLLVVLADVVAEEELPVKKLDGNYSEDELK